MSKKNAETQEVKLSREQIKLCVEHVISIVERHRNDYNGAQIDAIVYDLALNLQFKLYKAK